MSIFTTSMRRAKSLPVSLLLNTIVKSRASFSVNSFPGSDPASPVVTRSTMLTTSVAMLLSPNIRQLPILDRITSQVVPLKIGRWFERKEWMRLIDTKTDHPGRHQT